MLRISTNVGVKTFSFCFVKREGYNFMVESSIAFAKTLVKSVAAVNTLIPSSCEQIVLR